MRYTKVTSLIWLVLALSWSLPVSCNPDSNDVADERVVQLNFQDEESLHKPGYCSMYDNCGKKSFFGTQLPCPANIEAVKPSTDSLDLLQKVCGKDFPAERICCSQDQLINLESNLKKADPLISSCPACRKNFYDFFCHFTCSPDQSSFVSITKTGQSIDTHEEIVTELTQFVDPEYAAKFFDSCKDLKFSATNGYAMDLIGGGATNYSQFLKFLGDEKPLLGGSPFQINFKYDLNDKDAKEGVVLRKGDTKSCADSDPKYRCSCSDCPSSCPTLPAFKNPNYQCKVGTLPCFSFSIIIIWSSLILALGAYHIWLARRKRAQFEQLNQILESDDDHNSADLDLAGGSNESELVLRIRRRFTSLKNLHANFICSIESVFARVGYFCASFPAIVIGTCLVVSIFFSLGLLKLDLEQNPVNLWVSPNEPALHNSQYFEKNFGEWFRIEQIIVSTRNESEPVLNWDNIEWWFNKEAELQSFGGHGKETLDLNKYCFQPLENGACAVESFTQYFQGNINFINPSNWKKQLKSCTDSPVNCLPTFQQPLKKNLLFSSDDVFDSQAFVVTILINNNSTNEEYTNEVVRYEHHLQKWILDLQEEVPHLKIDFSTETSLQEELNRSTNTDINVIIISYLVMFLYASLALGGKIPTRASLHSLVLTRFQLGLGGIIIILLSVTSAAGIFSVLGVKSTLIIAEVIPFLVLAIGIDNIFLIVHELHIINETTTEYKTLEFRISEALGKIGPSCLISAVLQVSMFALASTVAMPAVRNFAIYSAGAVTINFLLQMTGFVSLLAIDQKRLEEGRVDCAPWVQANKSISLSDNDANGDAGRKQHVEYNFSGLIRKYYAPWLLKPQNKRKVLTVFLLWMGVSLSLLPGVKLGLDQRIALPQGSYLIDYFNAVYNYLNVGPPMFLVVKDLDVTQRSSQQFLCGKFATCNEYSVANVLEQEFKRGHVSTITEPASNWLDDFLNWLNPDLDQCCRLVKQPKGSAFESRQFCKPHAPERQCEPCYSSHDPAYSPTMEGLPTGDEFMTFFHQWIQEPSDPCPLGGKAPYGNSISVDPKADRIRSSYFRTSHAPLRSQDDFISAHRQSLRIVEEVKQYARGSEKTNSGREMSIFAFSPFYVFFVQYESIVKLTFTLMGIALLIIWTISVLLLGSFAAATVLTITVLSVVVNIGGVLSLWSISLNAVSLVNLVICVGLAVEFTIHITRAYVKSSGEDDVEDEEQLFNRFMNGGDGRHLQQQQQQQPHESHSESVTQERVVDTSELKDRRAFSALVTVGGSVIGGITITKVIGISVLAFTRSKIFEVYYFRMWLSLVVIAAIHALVLLPVLLSYFGGTSGAKHAGSAR